MATLAQFATLEEAKAFTQYSGKMISRVTMNSLLAQFGLFNAFLAEAATDDRFAAFMDSTSTEYNFMQGTAAGDAQIAMLDAIIAEGKFPALATLKPVVIGMANEARQPFANATLHEFQVAKGTVAKKALPVSANGDAVFINVTTACERHSPNITLANGTRIGAFYQVANTGFYFAQIPNEYRGQSYFVDDAYQVIA